MVLGEIIEAKLRTSMARVETPLDFVNRPVSATIAVIIVLALTAHVWSEVRSYRQRRSNTRPAS
jgi:putative tricarboxylic transport membrane protein